MKDLSALALSRFDGPFAARNRARDGDATRGQLVEAHLAAVPLREGVGGQQAGHPAGAQQVGDAQKEIGAEIGVSSCLP